MNAQVYPRLSDTRRVIDMTRVEIVRTAKANGEDIRPMLVRWETSMSAFRRAGLAA